MNLDEIRKEIDSIDSQIVELFTKRMECSRSVAEYKLENGMKIFDPERELKILDKAEKNAGKYGSSARQLYAAIMELSRALQHEMLGSGEKLRNAVCSAKNEIPYSSSDLKLACFGVPGTYTGRACMMVFPNGTPMYYPSFQDVFSAIQRDEASFGVVPIENSTAGSVTEVYDLMLKYRYYIVSAVDISIDHCLAAKKGTRLEDVRKVYSHRQALLQCSEYLRSRGLRHEEYQSTAAAAQMAAASGKDDIAAICSQDAAREYGLEVLLTGFQNSPHNTTRFLVISKELYIENDADKISLCFSLPHRTGSLYNILCRFAADGLNLTKIESRPKADTGFEYLFYLDFAGNMNDKNTLPLMRALSDELADFSFLGNYKEH